jgi:hypothetical protein
MERLDMKLSFFGCCLLIIPLLGFAYSSNSYFCPATNNYINLGDSIDQVTKACGNPTETKAWTSTEEETFPVEQWLYNTVVASTHPQAPKSITMIFPMTLAINFREGKVVRILANNQTEKEGYFCDLDRSIKIGSTKDEVQSLCGYPAASRDTTQSIQKNPTTQLVYVYQPDWYSQPVSLYFENLKLVRIEQ